MSSFLRLFGGVTVCAGGERSRHGDDGGGHIDDGVDNSDTGGGLVVMVVYWLTQEQSVRTSRLQVV